MDYDDIPWTDAKNWKPGCWYPLPVSSMWCDKITVVEGYSLYYKDPTKTNGDILPVVIDCDPFNFRTAVNICEAHNEWSFNLIVP